MGIIQRQAIKNSIVNYAGVAIGILSALFIYPLAPEHYGLFRVLFDSAILCTPFILLGSNSISVRFFPLFNEQGEGRTRGSFLGLLIAIIGIGIIIFLSVFPLIKSRLASLYIENAPLLVTYLWAIVPIAVLIAGSRLIVTYTSNFQRIVVPSIFNDFLLKLTLPGLILLLIYHVISEGQFVWGIILHYVIVFLGVLIYLAAIGHLHFRFRLRSLGKEMFRRVSQYGLYSILAFIGSQLAFRIDSLMVSGLISLKDAGIYTIVAVLSEIIIKPSNAIKAVSGPIIAEKIEKNDIDHVKDLYQRSSLNLLFIGLFIFLTIWLSIDEIFQIMNNTSEMTKGLYVIFFLGIARIVDMATGLNNEIINYSKYYAWGLAFLLVLAISNIIANILLIESFGLVGAAIATLISVTLFNLMKLIFIWVKFKIQPFQIKMLWILILAVVGYWIVAIIPFEIHPVVSLFLKSIIFAIIFVLPVYFMKLSSDLNDLVSQGIKYLQSTSIFNRNNES